ncbi:MarR family transcriptional regulator [Streptomyces sp. TG1A-8]|uniref:MarR family winged helix-turn-helix transcriptional regulator n=1 Tax=Streptomyces sp. TG1A-8 TaxID=3051385 RepID=UPI00265BBB50|nr:MarR family transcriptional regulator [Streptomyces sp. TG1A-8]MDO0929554.1 MarR family transcriptional regulator [Streptomyces sp. TG1A-8]
MSSKKEQGGPVQPPGTVPAGAASADLVWLAHRAAAALGDAFNGVAREAGLSDLRHWLVLALIADGPARTQLQIATELGIDKTTMVSILDRLERDGLIVRRLSARDRRVRIPEATEKGVEVKERVAVARETAISRRLATIPASEHAKFHAMLWSIVEGG